LNQSSVPNATKDIVPFMPSATLDWLDLQQRDYPTQRDLAQARYNYLLGRLRLAAAPAQLTDDEIKAVKQIGN
jgi:outer membrane protein TolC